MDLSKKVKISVNVQLNFDLQSMESVNHVTGVIPHFGCPFPEYTPCITYVNGNLVRCTNLNNNQNSKRKLANPTEKLAAASAEIGFQLSMLRCGRGLSVDRL